MGMIYRGRKIDVGKMGRLLEMACLGKRGWDPVPSGKAVLGQDHRQFTIATGEKAGHRSRQVLGK